jgi:hypothetical protein
VLEKIQAALSGAPFHLETPDSTATDAVEDELRMIRLAEQEAATL